MRIMTERDQNTLGGSVFDETTEITVTELCEVCSVEYALIEELVEEGVLDPLRGPSDETIFHFASVRRIRTVVRLQQDLGVNLAGAALALELLERIDDLRRQLRDMPTDAI
jgi:chaperone modulatory protein CbpM